MGVAQTARKLSGRHLASAMKPSCKREAVLAERETPPPKALAALAAAADGADPVYDPSNARLLG